MYSISPSAGVANRARSLALVLSMAASLAGCFSDPKVNVGAIQHCKTNDSCPSGYICTVNGTCCASANGQACNSIDASTQSEAGGTGSIDSSTGGSSGMDGAAASATGGSGGTVDAIGLGGSGGSTTLAYDGATTDGAGGLAQSDASVSESPADLATRDVAIEAATIDIPAEAPIDVLADAPVDAPGTCSMDKDCPVQTPLCLGSKCAKCTTDTDCVGRTGPACQTSSGLCVACTADKYCTGTAAKCNTTTNQCAGCVVRSDCSGVCQACTSGVCTSVKNQDDPGVCAGTCDSNGACKAKQGQICQSGTDCVGGICSDGYCCNRACSST